MADENDGLTIHFAGHTYKVEDFELDELEFVERYANMPLASAAQTIAGAKAFITVIRRRSDPNYTIEQAGKLSLKVLNELTAEPEPQENGAAKPRPTKAKAASA